MSSRGGILGALANALEGGEDKQTRRRRALARLESPSPNLVPGRGQRRPKERVALFVEYATAADATVARVKNRAAAPQAVVDFLAAHNLPSEAVRAPDPALDAMPWDAAPMLSLRTGKAEPADQTGITGALAGIAETGTLMLISGEARPTTLNFLPDNHIVLLHADQVLGTLEDGWKLLRKNRAGDAPADMPRTINFITGPSRSADIEQTLQLGAHGPRRLHIILIDEPLKAKKT